MANTLAYLLETSVTKKKVSLHQIKLRIKEMLDDCGYFLFSLR
jgi:hypothetical protein